MKKILVVTACAALASVSLADVTSVVNLDSGAANVSLTTEGTTDWVMLGRGGDTGNRDEKTGVSYIGDVTVSGTHGSYSSSSHVFDWTDGNPTLSIGSAQGNWEAQVLGGLDATSQGLSFAVSDLAVGDYTMMIYASSYKATHLLTASMGAGPMTASQGYVNDSFYTSYSIDFNIENVTDVLDISLNRGDASGNDYSNVAISAITLAAIPEPATLGLVGLTGGGLLFIRRRFMI